MQATALILAAAAILLIGGPLLGAALGVIHIRRVPVGAGLELIQRWDWRLTLTSAFLYALAYSVLA